MSSIFHRITVRIFKHLPEKLKKVVFKVLRRREMDSDLLRELFQIQYRVAVGKYSYGCFDPERIPAGTQIGRYCSFGPGVRIFNGNHGINWASTHPYLYNPRLGYVEQERISRNALVIGDDVWIGANAIILPNVGSIGTGAVIGAGAVVTKDVPAFAIVAGNPATFIRSRFEQKHQEAILNSGIFNLPKDAFVAKMKFMYDIKEFEKL
ncbi:MAG: CatB-related O-acetyltransferase [Dyadobacter sp.]|uniref:CatB-related O-acetyltransferase n=1 Tax=Dyadobacter sp. TaxID=1914288 RepID=UPI001B2870C5|nr:CatB-related O-acetyltransferase [Dyadobacter sp.]MBO9616383.1 CatB-related O-acetyltransferase [Dyadobacter sp.]